MSRSLFRIRMNIVPKNNHLLLHSLTQFLPHIMMITPKTGTTYPSKGVMDAITCIAVN